MDSDPFTANATSRMSSDFRSAVSTSPLEHSLHHAGHLERACSAGMTSTVSAKRQRSTEAVGVPILDEVHPVWLEAAPGERYLLLEDADTGDMLMPLIYMKAVFEANYSRKLSALKHRLVTMPADGVLPDSRANAYLYWRWAFEAPPAVKLLVRQELGDDNTPQGHLRLVLLPIVYNAMALKEQLRGLPLFRALQGAICASAYDCLLRHPPPDPTTPDKQAGPGSVAGEAEGGTPAGSAAAPGNGAQPRLFAGPRDLAATAAKYMYNFREAEATDVSIKRPRLVHSASHDELRRGREGCHHHGAARQPAACSHAAELRRELRDWKRRVETQVETIFGELAIVKNCIMQLYNVLLPGKFPPMSQPPPPTQPQQHGRAIPPLQQPPPAYRQAHVQPRSLAHPGRAPTPPLPPAEQLRGSRLPDGLVSSGVAREASHESTTSAMPCTPNLAAFAHMLPPHMPHQIAPPPESMASSGLAVAPIPAQPGSESGQPMGHSFIMGHPAIHGSLSEGAATLALHVPQLRPAQRVPSQQHWEAMQGMASAAAQLAPQHPPFSMPTPWR